MEGTATAKALRWECIFQRLSRKSQATYQLTASQVLFDSWHDFKVCQWRVLERHCRRRGLSVLVLLCSQPTSAGTMASLALPPAVHIDHQHPATSSFPWHLSWVILYRMLLGRYLTMNGFLWPLLEGRFPAASTSEDHGNSSAICRATACPLQLSLISTSFGAGEWALFGLSGLGLEAAP